MSDGGFHLLQFFAYTHLTAELQSVSKNFYDLAFIISSTLPPNEQREVALRKLLEAKDCAVRAKFMKGPP